MRVLIRADASVEIGSGHVMRCASLAARLREAGHEVSFLCRTLPGNFIGMLEETFPVRRLYGSAREWTEDDDAKACRNAIGAALYDWLIVDHYSLGVHWERAIEACAERILAIDDLGREHRCHLLLDQNFPNPVHDRYRSTLPADCERLLGPHYALLRPDFAGKRAVSLARPRNHVERLLVFMGGSDPLDETSMALRGIAVMGARQPVVDVVIGAANPHRDAVAAACTALASATLHVQTQEMAALMARADCAIGTPGSATWERCTLGLPAIVTILAENQTAIGPALDAAGAHRLLGRHGEVSAADYADALGSLDAAALQAMSVAAAAICDGAGAQKVAARLEASEHHRSADKRQRLHA
jgi:UDP-2,4-diacetamido-2,4,6-trideoxy-beta-L-altropyranose hydrolase